jgi:hypothetical protein
MAGELVPEDGPWPKCDILGRTWAMEALRSNGLFSFGAEVDFLFSSRAAIDFLFHIATDSLNDLGEALNVSDRVIV